MLKDFFTFSFSLTYSLTKGTVLSLEKSEYSVMEGDSTVRVCARLSGPNEREVIMELTSSPLTANDTTGIYLAVLVCRMISFKTTIQQITARQMARSHSSPMFLFVWT